MSSELEILKTKYDAVCARATETYAHYEKALAALKAERDELMRYKCAAIAEFQKLRRELEKCESESYRNGLLALDAHNHAVERMRKLSSERDEARAECERLRAACKRNPSSGSCIEALREGERND